MERAGLLQKKSPEYQKCIMIVITLIYSFIHLKSNNYTTSLIIILIFQALGIQKCAYDENETCFFPRLPINMVGVINWLIVVITYRGMKLTHKLFLIGVI